MKPNIRHLGIVFGAVALLFGGAMALFFGAHLPPTSALPNPNGYDDLVRSSGAVIGRTSGALDLDRDALRAFVATNAESLRLLRLGLSRSCAVPTQARIANLAGMSAEIIGLKSVAHLACEEGRLAEMEKRPGDAAQSYMDAIHLGNEMSRGGFLINRLVGIACEGMGSIALVKVLPALDSKSMQSVAKELDKIDDGAVSWKEIMQNESRLSRTLLFNYRNPIDLASDWLRSRGVNRAIEERNDLTAAHLRLIATELALRSYRCNHGAGPVTLRELVPEYLPRIPVDPFGGGPLVYRPSGTNWVLYSIGPDRKDDGGKPARRKMSKDTLIGLGIANPPAAENQGDVLYDSGW